LKFSTYRPDDPNPEPIELELNDKIFYFKPEIPGMTLLGYLEAADAPSNSEAAKGIRTMFNETLVTDPADFPEAEIPEDNAKAFFDYVEDPDNHVDLPKLQDMANGLVEEYAVSRPTQSSPKSDDGSATNGSGRTGKRSAKAATSGRSR
jgi:hypothetical protein